MGTDATETSTFRVSRQLSKWKCHSIDTDSAYSARCIIFSRCVYINEIACGNRLVKCEIKGINLNLDCKVLNGRHQSSC